jgi:lysophospholipase L1-like esterase
MAHQDRRVAYRKFAALGDSFTEGLEDQSRADGRHRGWADRVADRLAARSDGLAYANLAVRGRLVADVIEEQVPRAVAMTPDLVTLGAGVNDTLRPRFDLRAAATAMDRGVRLLRGGGADVLLFTFGDPSRRSRVMRPVADRIRALNSAVEAIADRYGCRRVNFWDVAAFDDPQLWSDDWLHLAPAGHELVAEMVLAALDGVPGYRPTPPVPRPREALRVRARSNARWTREHLAPWVLRRVRGQSSGDEIGPKQAEWVVWRPGTAPSSPGDAIGGAVHR